MSAGTIEERIRRLYTAIGETVEDDLSTAPAVVRIVRGRIVSFKQDFSGGKTPEQIQNHAHTAIAMVAGLRDHLLRWAKESGRDRRRVDAVISASPDLQILIDLWNAEKHGSSGRKSWSRRSPQLKNVSRGLRVLARATGEPVELIPSIAGLDAFGSPHLRIVTTGKVVDGTGKAIGELSRILENGLRAWEGLLKEFGLLA